MKLKLFFLTAILFTTIVGFLTLSFQKNAFADTKMLYCASQTCNGLPCTTNMHVDAINPPDDCITYTLTCKDCLDYKVSGCLCNSISSTYCKKIDGSNYYGQTVPCPAQ